jgi:hypothetical protein
MVFTGAIASAGAAAPGTTVASGLMTPRNITLGPDGSLYIAEGGMGGEEPIVGAPDDPQATGGTRGYTGQITKVAPNGTKTVVAKGLPSYGGGEVVGPADVVYANNALWVVTGSLYLELGLKPLNNEAAVVKIDPATGTVTKVADIGAYEAANNPDTYGINSNPYGMTLGADGNLYVADAGANTVFRVNPTTGAIAVAAVIPGLPVTAADFPPGTFPPDVPFGNPGRGGKAEVDPVPTSVTAGEDGSLYVTLLPGALLPNKAKVVRIAPNGTVSDVLSGLTTLVGSAAGPDGNLYVTSLTAGFAENGPPAPGSVYRVLPGGKWEVVVTDLPFPNGITFDDAGNLYITTFTINPGQEQVGAVVRFDGIAKVAAPSPSPSSSPIPSPPPTGNGGALPGLPNTGAGGGEGLSLPLAGLLLEVSLGGSLFVLRRRAL